MNNRDERSGSLETVRALLAQAPPGSGIRWTRETDWQVTEPEDQRATTDRFIMLSDETRLALSERVPSDRPGIGKYRHKATGNYWYGPV